MTDKSKELSTTVKLINERLNFSGKAEGNSTISIDYIPPLGDNLGYTSLELLLLSLSSCIGSAMLVFLRRMQKSIIEFEVITKGIRNEDHPTGFKSILVSINLKSPDINETDLKKVAALVDEKYCPVWSMLKGNVAINLEYNISK